MIQAIGRRITRSNIGIDISLRRGSRVTRFSRVSLHNRFANRRRDISAPTSGPRHFRELTKRQGRGEARERERETETRRRGAARRGAAVDFSQVFHFAQSRIDLTFDIFDFVARK